MTIKAIFTSTIFLIMLFICGHLFSQIPGRWIKVDAANYEWYETKSVVCCDSNDCITLSNMNNTCCVLLRQTTDGGDTWNEVYIDTIYAETGLTQPGIRISYPGKDFVAISHFFDLVTISRDSMKTWTKFKSHDSSLVSFIMFDEYNGFRPTSRVLKGTIIFDYTSDGGKSWKNIDVPLKYKFLYGRQMIPFTKTQMLFLAIHENEGLKLLKINSEGSWTELNCPENTKKLYFLDNLNGWLVADMPTEIKTVFRQYIAQTFDGGKSWNVIRDTLDKGRSLDDIYFCDKNNGIAVGLYYTLIRTNDGGKTWYRDQLEDIPIEKQGTETSKSIYQIGYLSHNSGLIRGYGNCIYKYFPNPVSVEEIENINTDKLLIYPNPVKSDELDKLKFKIPVGLELNKIDYKIYELNGNLLYHTSFEPVNNSLQNIGLSNIDLKSGVYFLKLQSNGSVFNVPFVVY